MNLGRIKQALWDAFHGTAQPTTVDGSRLHLDEVGWQVDTAGRAGYEGLENVPVTDESTQATIYGQLIRQAACDPDIAEVSFFGFRDDGLRTGFKAALQRADGSTRPAAEAVRAAIAEAASGCVGDEPRWPPDEIWHLAEGLVPPGRGYDWTQALMDTLGATFCTARSPSCANCPTAHLCSSARTIRRATALCRGQEPSLNGIPNRIYRGKVIELLRTEGRHSGVSAGTLGQRILPRFLPGHEPWLRNLLEGLRKDGLIRLRANHSFLRTRVRLA